MVMLVSRYTVQENETLLDIALRELGTRDVSSIVRHPLNKPVFRAGRTEHVLLPGDEIELPAPGDPEPQRIVVTTGRRNRLVATRHTRSFEVRLVDLAGNAIAGAVTLTPNQGARIEGEIGEGGWVRERIDVRATEVRLELPDGTRMRFIVGGLDPAHTLRGVQARLRALGYLPGPVDGKFGLKSQSALRAFQAAHNLEVTGVPDPDTVSALRDAYGE